MIHPLLKPKNQKRLPSLPVVILEDGKEICKMNSAKGRSEYRRRTLDMFERQDGICRWCEEPMFERDATFDHDNGRTKGNQDDRIFEADGPPQNAAVHYHCNTERASSRILTRSEWLAWKANKSQKAA